MDHRTTPIRTTASTAEAAGIVRLLHDTRWGWHREDVDALLAAHPEWKLHRDLPDTLAIGLVPGRGHLGPELIFTPRENKAKVYRKAEVALAFHGGAPEADVRRMRAELVEALSVVGEPVAHRISEHGTGLRWRQDGRVLLLHGGDARTWLAVRPAVVGSTVDQRLLDAVTALAPLLHDNPTGTFDEEALEKLAAEQPHWELGGRQGTAGRSITVGPGGAELSLLRNGAGYHHIRLFDHPEGGTPADRPAVFGELLAAVCAVLGEPTTLGGGPSGPDVRWRSTGRVLRLRGTRRRVVLESEPTEELEQEEYGTFEWGGPSSDGSSDFPLLPYTWQLHRGGPGEEAVVLPGGRLALTVPHLREGLEVLLAAWAEQLPVQVPGERAQFKIVNRRDRKRTLAVSLEPSGALHLIVPDRAGDPAEGERAMTAAGWKRHGKRWRAVYPHPDGQAAAAAAELITAELVARGVTDPSRDLGAKDVRCGTSSLPARGFFQVTGLGIERC
ncbi:hypothetical protein [Kitasatospora sp. NPDC085879]|uniref:hypothetical protein n=1 Tax=Kitasatospora sp. NPDC085879 TaxID=3154769 RepID=UPI003442BECF